MRNLLFVAACLMALASCKNSGSTDTAASATTDPTATSPAAESTTGCYIRAVGRDTTFANITIAPDGTVTGSYDWAPHEQDGAHGTLAGKKESDRLQLIYDYTIEGSNQQQEMVMRMAGDQLFEGEGELTEDEGGVLKLKDASKLNWKPFLKVACK